MQTLKLYKIIQKNKEDLQNQEREARSQGRIGWLPVWYFLASSFSIIWRTALRRDRSSSGSLFENFVITGFQSSNDVCTFLTTWESFGNSKFEESSKAFSKNSNNTDTISEDNVEYNFTRFFKHLVHFLLEPESKSTSIRRYNT